MLEDIIKERLKKRSQLLEHGQDPYPSKLPPIQKIKDVLQKFFWLSFSKRSVTVAGRVTGFRNQGGVFFLDLRDESGSMQAVGLKKDLADFALYKENIDIGDFVSVSGSVF